MTNRVLMGVKDGTHGLYVSKPGYDVTTCGAADLIFDSRLGNYGSVLMSGTTTMDNVIYFPATLGYVPLVYAYCINGYEYSGSILLANVTNTGATTGLVSQVRVITIPFYTVTNSYINFNNPGYPVASGQNFYVPIRYVVWRSPGA